MALLHQDPDSPHWDKDGNPRIGAKHTERTPGERACDGTCDTCPTECFYGPVEDDDLTPEQEHEIAVRLNAIRGCLVAAMELCTMLYGVGEGEGLILDIAKAHSHAVEVQEGFKSSKGRATNTSPETAHEQSVTTSQVHVDTFMGEPVSEVVCWNCDEARELANMVRYSPADAALVAGPNGEHPDHDVLVCIPCHIAIREHFIAQEEAATN